VLDCPAGVALKRKREIEETVLEELSEAYSEFVRGRERAVAVDAAQDPDVVAREASWCVLSFMQEREHKRMTS
jgi:tRNA G10  N-methylase Trm11